MHIHQSNMSAVVMHLKLLCLRIRYYFCDKLFLLRIVQRNDIDKLRYDRR